MSAGEVANGFVGDVHVANEKQRLAIGSLVAGIVISVGKLVLGIVIGSLALISDAIHSTADVVAAVITLIAVRVSDLPADATHNYGHGKIENLSAFGESLILILTALGIGYAAVIRLMHPHRLFHTSAAYVAIALMAVVLIITTYRAIRLVRSYATKRSSALRANLLHFVLDVVSAVVVLVSLILDQLTHQLWVDPVGALLIAVIILAAAMRLAKQSVDVLMDRAPAGLESQLQDAIRRVPGVSEVPRVRARQSGSQRFVDATIVVPAKISLEESHRIATSVELAADAVDESIDVMVHVEPGPGFDDPSSVVRSLAEGLKFSVHAINVQNIYGRLYLSFHVDVPANWTVADAHAKVSELESRIKARMPNVAEIHSHIEPAGK